MFKRNLNFRRQYVPYLEGIIPSEKIKCGVTQGSILGSVLFWIFVNDLHHVANFLDSTMFADDINLFYSNSNVNELLENANKELANVTDWIFANRLSINTSKTKYTPKITIFKV